MSLGVVLVSICQGSILTHSQLSLGRNSMGSTGLFVSNISSLGHLCLPEFGQFGGDCVSTWHQCSGDTAKEARRIVGNWLGGLVSLPTSFSANAMSHGQEEHVCAEEQLVNLPQGKLTTFGFRVIWVPCLSHLARCWTGKGLKENLTGCQTHHLNMPFCETHLTWLEACDRSTDGSSSQLRSISIFRGHGPMEAGDLTSRLFPA